MEQEAHYYTRLTFSALYFTGPRPPPPPSAQGPELLLLPLLGQGQAYDFLFL
jgi:hypothetical protein